MGGYLQRLALRSTPSAVSALRPFVHSRSPIVSLDQRIGLPGFEEVGLPQPARTPGEPDRAPLPVWNLSSGRQALRRPKAEAPPDGDGRPAELQRERDHVVPNPAGRPARPPSERSLAMPLDAGSPSARQGVREVTPPETDAADGVSGRAGAPVRGLPDSGGAAARPAVPASASMQVGDPSPYLTPSLPLPPVSARRAGAPSSQSAGETDRRPRLEIGAIQVEVVPPAPEAAAPSPPRPATAEGVSRIGPLGTRRRSNLRLALRHR